MELRKSAAILAAAALGGLGVAVALVLSGEAVTNATSCPSSSEALLSTYIKGGPKSYSGQNPVESAKVFTYLNGGVRPDPSAMTHMGKHLVFSEDDCRALAPVTTTSDTTTTTTTTTTSTTPVGCALSTPNVPDGPDNAGGCFPGPSNTGPNAPASSMAVYAGSCTISTANTVIDSKVVNCRDLIVAASGFVLKNSYENGGIIQSGGSPSFTVQDSLVDSGVQYPAASSGAPAGKYACGDPNNATTDCGVTGSNFTILRTEIIGSNRAAYCEAPGPCLIQDSYFHGTNLWPDVSNKAHASSTREEQNDTIRHNSLHCSYTGPFVNSEIGCSADLTGYPDFDPIKNNTVDGNLFVASIGSGFCAYGGGTAGKPFSGDPTNATNQKFTNNVFQRGSNAKCAAFGPITDFIAGRTGNVWSNNLWDDGAIVPPA
jgi:hypothetical protein